MLIRDTETLLKFTGNVTGGKDFDVLKPSVEWAEEFMLLPAIGQEMFDRLDALLDESGSGSVSGSESGSGSGSGIGYTSDEDLNKLLPKVQRVIAHYSMFDYSNIADSHVTATGLQIIESDTHKTAFEYQKRDRRKYHAEKADQSLDKLLEFLESNKDEYPEWSQNASVYTETKELVINNTRDFGRHVDIGNSRRTFMSLRTFIKDVGFFRLRPTLGDTIYAALMAYIKDNGSSENYKKLFDLVAPAVANIAIAEALPSLIFRLAGETITIATYNPLSEKEKDQFTSVTKQIIDLRNNRGEAYLDAAVSFIKSVPELLAISPYATDETRSGKMFENSADNKHFTVF